MPTTKVGALSEVAVYPSIRLSVRLSVCLYHAISSKRCGCYRILTENRPTWPYDHQKWPKSPWW